MPHRRPSARLTPPSSHFSRWVAFSGFQLLPLVQVTPSLRSSSRLSTKSGRGAVRARTLTSYSFALLRLVFSFLVRFALPGLVLLGFCIDCMVDKRRRPAQSKAALTDSLLCPPVPRLCRSRPTAEPALTAGLATSYLSIRRTIPVLSR
jgi:hypothetical protein